MTALLLTFLNNLLYFVWGWFHGRRSGRRSQEQWMSAQIEALRARIVELQSATAAVEVANDGDDSQVIGLGFAIHSSDLAGEGWKSQRARLVKVAQTLGHLHQIGVPMDESLREDLCQALEQVAAVFVRARAVGKARRDK